VTAARSKAWSAATGFVGLRVRIPPGTRLSVCRKCCVLSGSVIVERQQRGRLVPLGLSNHKNIYILFSDNLIPCTSRNVRDQFSHPSKTTEKVVVLKKLYSLYPWTETGKIKVLYRYASRTSRKKRI